MNAPALTPVELATGMVLGLDPEPPRPGTSLDPLAALADAIRPALERAPCLVSFSGGRDSSAVLGVATAVARREGLPLPIPATNVFPNAASTSESDWQERVVAHLGLADWVRLEFDDELDIVGPVAQRVLLRHGLLWPFNAHFHVPILEAASGGSLLTGIGGDEVFGATLGPRAADVLAARVRPGPRDTLRVGLALSPRPLRQRVLRSRFVAPFAWLRPGAKAELARRLTADAAQLPLRWSTRVRFVRRFRYSRVGAASLALLAADADAKLVHPLADPGFVEAFARTPRSNRPTDRTAAMRHMVGHLLPYDVCTRSTKTGFDEAFWGPHSRALAADWTGEGADADVIDVDALRETWAEADPDAHTFTFLQHALLARRAAALPLSA